MKPKLRLDNLCAGYNGSTVIESVSLAINEHEVVALLGANGVGKTTLMRVISGLLTPSKGTIEFEGRDLRTIAVHDRVELGLALCPEGRQVFRNLTVEKNLLLGSFSHHARPHREATLDMVYGLFPRLNERRTQKAGLLSGGEQQMLALGRSLMSRPALLMLDEPSLGLAPAVVLAVLASVSKIAASGTAILLAEQNVRAALAVATRAYVLARGTIVASGTAAEMAASPYVEGAFLGRASLQRRVNHADLPGNTL
jgi:branched-chain amino acid transport system ATP-binding protein